MSITPLPTQRHRQESLRKTLESLRVSSSLGIQDLFDSIAQRARDVHTAYGRNPPHLSGPSKSLVNAAQDPKYDWENQFEGQIHCEAYLAAKLQGINRSGEALMGVSKCCCYCCALLLEELGLNKEDLVTHGMVYPWTPPEDISLEVLSRLLRRMQDKLSDCLNEYRSGHRSPNSAAGSDREERESPPPNMVDLVSRYA